MYIYPHTQVKPLVHKNLHGLGPKRRNWPARGFTLDPPVESRHLKRELHATRCCNEIKNQRDITSQVWNLVLSPQRGQLAETVNVSGYNSHEHLESTWIMSSYT